MRVEIREGPEFRADFVRVLTRRTRQDIDALALAQVYMIDIVDLLTKHAGPPPSVDVVKKLPHDWWWLYVKDVWIGLRVKDTRRGIFKRAIRTITLGTVAPFPPGGPFPSA